MLPQWIIEKKRNGDALTDDEIREFIQGFTRGTIPDYQMAALAMAIYFRGLSADETAALTEAMLRSGDVLFVDSSHVLKAGSDVQHLMDEVFPRLASGVHIHVHDVFYPFEYPPGWLATGCAVNEAYALRALLQSSAAYEIVLFNTFLERFHRAWFAAHMPLVLEGRYPSGGIWLRRR